MYKKPIFKKSSIHRSKTEIGLPIQDKIKNVLEQNENLNEAPLIYTEKADGVMAGYNIRTDKWEIAVEAMDKINKIRTAKGEEKRGQYRDWETDRKSTRLNSSHLKLSRMPSSA